MPRTRSSSDQPKSASSCISAVEPPATPKASPAKSNKSASSTLAKKLKQLEEFQKTPFPDHVSPTPQEAAGVCDALAGFHGLPVRPSKIQNLDSVGANCGLVNSILDALIRTILSQNTSSANSTAARKSIEATFGKGPDYEAVRNATEEELRDAIKCGGLANVKAKVIKRILDQVFEREGELSLDRLHTLKDQDALRELVSFDGVGPKTASCVLLFCMGRESFAVDTHVFRITKALGWTPLKANRETAFQHLDVRIPGPLKYPLHSLLVKHGKLCKNCSANSSPTKEQKATCPLRAFLSKQPTKALEEETPKVDKIEDFDAEHKPTAQSKSQSRNGQKRTKDVDAEEEAPESVDGSPSTRKKRRLVTCAKKEESPPSEDIHGLAV